MQNARRTKIIATIGPATASEERLEQLVTAGLNIARINMSHATHDQARETVERIREVSRRLGRKVGILMDLQGPAIRTGELTTALNLAPGDRIALTVRGEASEEVTSVDVNYDDLVDDIQVGDVVLVDNGTIQLKVLEKRKNQLACEVLTQGVLGSRRHINLPGVRVNLPALTEKDVEDVGLAVELGIGWIAMSFCREAQDVIKLRGILESRKAPQKIMAKLEDQEGVANLEAIMEAADGIMVARGDLGIEVPFEELPIIQRRIVKRCVTRGVPVVVATHMLESMVASPSPTRAEITDVANAVFEQADAIMLSGETSVGAYPVKCVEIMDRIARRIERSGSAGYSEHAAMNSLHARLARSACVLARELKAAALIVFTRGGRMARSASWLRPLHVPVYAFTNHEDLERQLNLYWGVEPFFLDFHEDPLANVEAATRILRDQSRVGRGDQIVAITEVTYRGKLVDSILTERVD